MVGAVQSASLFYEVQVVCNLRVRVCLHHQVELVAHTLAAIAISGNARTRSPHPCRISIYLASGYCNHPCLLSRPPPPPRRRRPRGWDGILTSHRGCASACVQQRLLERQALLVVWRHCATELLRHCLHYVSPFSLKDHARQCIFKPQGMLCAAYTVAWAPPQHPCF